jgi:hypothetical protein
MKPSRIMQLSLTAIIMFASLGLVPADSTTATWSEAERAAFAKAQDNAVAASEAFERSNRFTRAWLAHADPVTGLTPRRLARESRDVWNAKDAAADCYPFMVVASAITDRELFDGKMLDMLRTEEKLTSRVGAMPDTYSFSKRGFDSEEVDLKSIIFGGSEYVKDGLMPVTEWLGNSPWSERMIAIVDDIFKYAPFKTQFGNIPSNNQEVNGELLQVLSRVYWMTGDKKYLDYAMRLGDYYLLGNKHPTRDEKRLRLRDHGCEIVSGLAELYTTVHFANPAKKESYRAPLYELLDCILEIGCNEHGMMYNTIDLKTRKPVGKGISDNWGYNYNAFYTVYQIDKDGPWGKKVEGYAKATRKALLSLNEHYLNYSWEGNRSADGFADSIECGLYLYRHEPLPSLGKWLDSEMKILLAKQRPDGVIEGWYGDGNFARTATMYGLLKTRGTTPRPWRHDLRLGAEQLEDTLYISLSADWPWDGKVLIDRPRHKDYLHMPVDYPRINQFPEWFTAESDKQYSVDIEGQEQRVMQGKELIEGLEIRMDKKPIRIRIQPL